MVMEKHVLVYDKDCGNCSRLERIVNILDAHRRLDCLSLGRGRRIWSVGFGSKVEEASLLSSDISWRQGHYWIRCRYRAGLATSLRARRLIPNPRGPRRKENRQCDLFYVL